MKYLSSPAQPVKSFNLTPVQGINDAIWCCLDFIISQTLCLSRPCICRTWHKNKILVYNSFEFWTRQMQWKHHCFLTTLKRSHCFWNDMVDSTYTCQRILNKSHIYWDTADRLEQRPSTIGQRPYRIYWLLIQQSANIATKVKYSNNNLVMKKWSAINEAEVKDN